jgi:hypothetical protein
MNFELPVKASWFYTLKSEKIKFNWFCYEYACVYYELLVDNSEKKLKKWLSVRDKKQVAEYCAYFAKRMKKGVEDKLEGITYVTETDEDYISDYCHESTYAEITALMGIAIKAWDQHTSVCVTCPTRCISERYVTCEFFDRMSRGGYLI